MSFVQLDKVQQPLRDRRRSSKTHVPSKRMLWMKRVFDVVLAILLLPLVALVCLIIAILNPFLNPGALFFVQSRIGQNEKTFRMLKFRTMVGTNDVARFATDEASRITRFGAFMRSKRIDELPQILNILRCEMSFIGPRPEQPGFYADFSRDIPNYALRQIVKPGISGLAQVEAGYADDTSGTRTKLRYDLHYISNMSVGMEAYIVGQTFKVLVTGFGAR